MRQDRVSFPHIGHKPTRRNSNAPGWKHFYNHAVDPLSPFPRQCGSPYNMIKIHGNGDLALCENIPVGNIMKDSITDIWNGATAQLIREGLYLNENNCASCQIKYCIGGEAYESENNSVFQRGSNLEHQNPTFIGNTGQYVLYSWYGKFVAVPVPVAVQIQKSNVLVEKVVRFANYKQYGILEATSYSDIINITKSN